MTAFQGSDDQIPKLYNTFGRLNVTEKAPRNDLALWAASNDKHENILQDNVRRTVVCLPLLEASSVSTALAAGRRPDGGKDFSIIYSMIYYSELPLLPYY